MKKPYILIISIALTMFIGCASQEIRPSAPIIEQGGRCQPINEAEIIALFDHWKQTLLTGDPGKVVALYAERSILLPTVSNKPRLTSAEKEEYFHYFLKKCPSAKIDFRQIQIGCNMAVDSGLYTFTFAKTGEVVSGRYSFAYRWDGSQWLIVSHHSSIMPEIKK
jgi:uncharacterized protein (TIGR02246 family)